ncbi:MAG: DUF5615 family PIN-like protein [Chloroflexi bacterium]|nr:DUF5615 family PIN-like protein [Chloroflexota bacterium]
MSIAFYMDQHVPRSITNGLRARGVDVLTAYEDGASELEDATLLDRATALRRVLFTRDRGFLVEGARRQKEGVSFAGIIYAHQLEVTVRTCIEDLELIAKVEEQDGLANEVVFLPL